MVENGEEPPGNGTCGGLNEKFPPMAHVFKHLVSSLCFCLRGYGTFKIGSLQEQQIAVGGL